MAMADTRDRLAAALTGPIGLLGLDLEAVDLTSAGKRRVLRVAIDKDGGVTMDDIADATREVSRVLDDTNVYSGTKHYALYMYIDTTVDVYVADATSPNQTVALPVRAAVGSAVAGYYQKSGSYAVFAKGAQPSFRSGTTPARKYRCLKHEVWRESSSGWKVVSLSACKVENSSGVVTWQWTGTHPSGVHFRVRARFFGDSLNHANSGAFVYFRFK